MPKHRLPAILSKVLKPTRILFVVMLVVIIWLLPPATLTRFDETSRVPHIQIADAQDEDPNDPCIVCVAWKLCSPGDHNPDTSGNCCTKTRNICTTPPTISGVLNCAQWGSNGWCIGYETIDLSASDPAGSAIMISGDVNGVPFACPNQNTSTLSCSVPLPQGAGAINFIVTSLSGQTASGSSGYWLDTSTPQVSGTLNGSGGTNNWFISNVILSASAVDSVSGVASLQTNVDDGGWTAYTSPLTLSDGIHTVAIKAVDNAGNTNQTTQTVQVDTITPALNLSIAGTAGSNGWYTSTVQISATAGDTVSTGSTTGGSGLATLEVSQDGSAYVPYTNPISFSDGIHAYQFKATDNAGNVTETTQSIQVDTITPGIALNLSGTQGLGGWYTSSVNVSAAANDSGSGAAQLQVSRDGGSYIPYTAPVNFSDGVHTYQFKATDNSGNVTETPLQTVYVDTIFPAISMSEDVHLGDTIYFSLQDDGSQLSEVRVVIFDGNERYDKIAWIESVAGKKYKDQFLWDGKFADGTQAPVGTYYVKLKVADAAGNETIKTSTVTVDMFRFLDVIPPFIPPGSPLSAGDDTTASSTTSNSSNTNFGGTASSDLPTSSSSSLSSGGITNPFTQGGGLVTFGSNSTNSQSTNLPTSSILWGAAATAAIGAFAAEIQKKKEEEAAARAAARLAAAEKMNAYKKDETMSYAQIAKAYEASLNSFKTTLKKAQAMGMSDEQAAQLKADAINSGKIGGSLGAAQEYIKDIETRVEYRMSEHDGDQAIVDAWNSYQADQAKADYRKGEWDGDQSIVDAWNLYQADQVKVDYRRGEWDGDQAIVDAWNAHQAANAYDSLADKRAEDITPFSLATKLTKWFQQTPLYMAVVDPYLIQPVNTYVYEPYIKPAIEKVQQTSFYTKFQNILTPKNIASTLLTVALGATTFQWINNVVSNPDISLPLQDNAQLLIEELRTKHPQTPENLTLSYLFTHPYDVASTGADVWDTFTSIGISYADAIWQQSPLIQAQIASLESLENSICTSIFGQSWSNRCTAVFYLGAGLSARPFDTGLGVVNGFIVDPVSGVIKQGALIVEATEGLSNAYQQGGIQAVLDASKEIYLQDLKIVLNDRQLQSAIFFEILAVLAILFAPVAAGIVLGLTGKGLIDLDIAITGNTDKKSLIELITSHDVRTTVVSSVLVLGLITAGLGEKTLEFRSFQDSLSPSVQEAFGRLSLLEQIKIADLAVKMKLSPGATEFYLTESARPGSPLADLSLTDALRVSSLAEQTGQGALLIDYVARYGYTDALRMALPEVVKGMVNDQFLVQAQEMLSQNTGYNVSPESWFTSFKEIGQNGTYITNESAIKNIIPDFKGSGTITISEVQAVELAKALGLKNPNALVDGFRISRITDIGNMDLSYPLDGSTNFLGPGKGLPGGGTEMKITPSLPVDSPNIVEQIIVEVIP